ncbi:hypothetical protein IW261DRAFT_1450167 [Armillaria novae-zelandiae]|uniref:BBC1/AIM3 cysteine proteinase-fold domain-containing protein n=1 Tax=Armillaria novae-zelandiae TaxID=153914 RepID=A0AA39PP08_9AGAR|nr:hypothetical protein IW261DRAFT_1450167 [Armillaria novae-zelandiae]
MSDQPSPPAKPKPGSLRDRIAAFEKPTNVSTPGPAPVPRPKPGAVSWKPRTPSPSSVHPGGDSSAAERRTGGMSASDAKESIGKGGSLRERMAALQGRGAFGAPPPPPTSPKPVIERPKWKPPPPVASPPPDDHLEKDSVPRKSPEIPSKSPDSLPAQPSTPTGGEHDAPAVAVAASEPEGRVADETDPEDEERQRRATIAARMARLGGARVGMGPPVFGKVSVKPKPKAEPVEEEAKPVEVVSPPPPSGDDEALKSAPTSPPLGEGAGSKALDVEQSDEGRSSESFASPDTDISSLPARTPASMPVPAGPRRAAPPRRKPAKSPAPSPAEDKQKNRESLASLDITSHPISDAEGAPKEEALNVVTEPALESPTETATTHTANEGLISPHVAEADVADIRVSPESPSFQGRIDLPEAPTKTSESGQQLDTDEISDVPVEEHLSPDPEPSVPSVEEEEEDEETRRNRVAEKIARMGGISPFAPPPLQRKPSTSSNVSDVVAPQSPTVQKRASIGSVLQSPKSKLSVRKPSIDEISFEEQSSSIPSPPRRRSSQLSEKSPAITLPPTRTRSIDSVTSGEQIHAKRRSQDDAIFVQDEPEPGFPVSITEEPESFEEEINARGAAAVEAEKQAETKLDTESVDEDQGLSTHEEKASLVIEDQDEINDDDARLPQLANLGPPPPLPPSSTRPPIPASEPVTTPPPPPPPLRRLSIQRVDDDDIVVVSPKRTSISPLASTAEVEDAAIFAPPPLRSVPPPPSVEHDSPISPTSPLQIPPPRSFSILQSQTAEEDDETTPLPHPGPFHRPVPPPQRSLSQSSDQSEMETPLVSVHPHPHRSIPPVPVEEIESDQEAIPLPPPPPRRPSPAPEEQPLIIPPPVRRESTKIPPGLEVNRRPYTPPMSTPTVSVSDHSSEQEILDEEEGDPIDPIFHSPSRRASYNNIQDQAASHIREPASPSASVSSHIREPAAAVPVPAAVASPEAVAIETVSVEEPIEAEPEQERRRTIAERMAKLGGIKFGAAPIPTSRPPPPSQRSPEIQDDGAEGTRLEQEEPESAEELDEEEEERARKERIAAKLASMGGMRIGMMPLGVGVLSPSSGSSQKPPHPSVRAPPMPRAPPPTETQETDSEQESQATSDDVVKVEAEEESDAEEVRYEEVDELPEDIPPPPIPTREGRRASVQRQVSTDVPPVTTQSPSRPPLPPGRPPVPTTTLPRRTSAQTVTSIKSSYSDASANPPQTHKPQYDFVMVEEPEAQDIPPKLVTRPPPRGPPPPPPPFSDNNPPRMELSDSISSQWELPSIPSSSLEFGTGGNMSVPWTDDAAETETAVPAPAPAPEIIKPAKSQEDAVLTSEELIAIWGRIGVQVCEVATSLNDKSKKALIGDGTYHGFIEAVLNEVPGAAPPSPPSYGYVIYMQSGSSVQKRAGEIMPGDVVWLSDAKLKGHKGIQTYSQHVGTKEPLVGIISEFEAKKFKLRVFQANQHVGQQTVESVSYRLEDLKSGVVKVFRILEA